MTTGFALDFDTDLMLRVRQGDASSFDVLLQRHRAAVVNHLYRTVHNRAIAEELAQDVFLRVYRSRERYQPEAKFTTWLFRITTNVALNWRRDTRHDARQLQLDEMASNGTKLDFPDGVPVIEELLVEQSRAAEIRRAVESLPEKQLAAVLLHKYEGMDYAQIANILHCSLPALKSTLFRAYQTLRQRLAHLAPVEETADQISG